MDEQGVGTEDNNRSYWAVLFMRGLRSFLLVHLARIAAEDISSDYLSRMDGNNMIFVMAKLSTKLRCPMPLATIYTLSVSVSA